MRWSDSDRAGTGNTVHGVGGRTVERDGIRDGEASPLRLSDAAEFGDGLFDGVELLDEGDHAVLGVVELLCFF